MNVNIMAAMRIARSWSVILLTSSLALLAGCTTHLPTTSLADANTHGSPHSLAPTVKGYLCEAEWPEGDNLEDIPAEVNLWDRIRHGFALPRQDNPNIQTHINWYASNPSYMNRVSERARRYMYYIVDSLEVNDMPLEIALLPIVESAFDPFAYSHGRAAGMWQFIPGTGRNFGLKQNWWYDGRRDISASTQAAIKYLTRLHNQFDGDWLLALAAYNTGEGNVAKAIRRNKKAGKPTDFWSLSLPRETSAYVPQLLALAEIVSNPEKYSVNLSDIPNRPYFASVPVGSQIDLAHAASMAGMDIDDLYRLNPGFNRWATDPAGPHNLLIPVDKAEAFTDHLASYNAKQRINWERYAVKSGDSLISIAKRYHTTVDALKAANKLPSHMIRKGQKLLVPVPSMPTSQYSLAADQRLQEKQSKSPKNRDLKVMHTVAEGDSFWKISRQHGVSVGSLAKWNGLAPRDTLKVGQQLVIWKKDTSLAASSLPTNSAQSGVIRKVGYKVRSGDSLARIASKFNVKIEDIAKWNGLKVKQLIHPGQYLKLFVDVTRAR